MIEVNETYCKGCNLCIEFCPRDALEPAKEINEKGVHPPVEVEGRCNNCRLCEQICPDFAIVVIEDEEEQDE
ncbi:MAG: 4Fe-4S dicluster domain-containing protein [Thermoplasmatota archaeon]